MSKLQYIFAGIGITLCTLYVLWAMLFVRSSRGDLTCAHFDVVVTDSTESSFVNRAAIKSYIARCGEDPTGRKMSEVNTDTIERLLGDYAMIRDAQCYKTNGDRVKLVIRQRKPKFRFVGSTNYYVDTERKIMPVSTSHSAYVPVVTGLNDHKLAQTVIYDFVDYVSDDEFWNAQIEQIVVNADTTITIVPRVGNHTILLGKPERYEQKLDKMMQLYQKGFAIMGWPDYKTIDLSIKNQIICKK